MNCRFSSLLHALFFTLWKRSLLGCPYSTYLHGHSGILFHYFDFVKIYTELFLSMQRKKKKKEIIVLNMTCHWVICRHHCFSDFDNSINKKGYNFRSDILIQFFIKLRWRRCIVCWTFLNSSRYLHLADKIFFFSFTCKCEWSSHTVEDFYVSVVSSILH